MPACSGTSNHMSSLRHFIGCLQKNGDKVDCKMNSFKIMLARMITDGRALELRRWLCSTELVQRLACVNCACMHVRTVFEQCLMCRLFLGMQAVQARASTEQEHLL